MSLSKTSIMRFENDIVSPHTSTQNLGELKIEEDLPISILFQPIFDLIQTTNLVLKGHLMARSDPTIGEFLITMKNSRAKIFDHDEKVIDMFNSVFSSTAVRNAFL